MQYVNYSKDDRGKSVRLQYPEFHRKGKLYYRIDGLEETEEQIVKGFRKLKKIEVLGSWSNYISNLLGDAKGVLQNRLMDLKIKEHNHGN